MPADLLIRKQTHFVLWRPAVSEPTPAILIGARGKTESQFREFPLKQSPRFPELWELAAYECQLEDGQVYYYWFKVRDANVYNGEGEASILYCTDPIAWAIDRRVVAPTPAEPNGASSGDPASVVLYRNGRLVPCDPDGQTVNWQNDVLLDRLPPNNRLVLYQLPPRWIAANPDGTVACQGSFRDILALVQPDKSAPNFSGVNALRDRAHLIELGVNALQLLPPADSEDTWEWGYGSSNPFAADGDLGRVRDGESPTASTDLANLIQTCHQQGLRFFLDLAIAYARANPYRNINFLDYFVHWDSGDPEQRHREAFGGDLFKYHYWVEDYHPISGEKAWFVPGREYVKTCLCHWMEFYRVDGLRLDSLPNVGNREFVEELKDYARSLWEQRGGEDEGFLAVGDDPDVPVALVRQHRVDGLWNHQFKQIARSLILGESAPGDSSFEWSLRKLIDCSFFGFTDGTQIVNYLTCHDVGGENNQRLYDYLRDRGLEPDDIERRIKLAFICLLTAVGIPAILAGEEFGDCQDLDRLGSDGRDHKPVDPPNYSRWDDPWRDRVFDYVGRLVRFRVESDALATNDTEFIHADFADEKRVFAWKRGSGEQIVIIVANFSDYGTPDPESPDAEYVVPTWPPTPDGKVWREITQDRTVDPEWAGREPIYPWEAKVYVLT